MKKIIISTSLVMALGTCICFTGCIGLPGQVSSSRSTFDGSVQVAMEPAWVYSGLIQQRFKLGCYRNSKMPTNEVVLVALVGGGRSIESGPSLKFNFDGEIVGLTSMDSVSDVTYDPGYYSQYYSSPGDVWVSKRYAVDVKFLRRLIETRSVTVRLELAREFAEGKISSDALTTVRPALRKFLASLEKGKAP